MMGCFLRGTNEFDPVTLSCRENEPNLALFGRFLRVYDEKQTSILLKSKEGKTSSFFVDLVKITVTFYRFEAAAVRSAAKRSPGRRSFGYTKARKTQDHGIEG